MVERHNIINIGGEIFDRILFIILDIMPVVQE